jgi:hypothetical protein|tara:strand:- start:1836 stop:2030 length:195 start_codon:yes stop_codon:yes gene_type:complete
MSQYTDTVVSRKRELDEEFNKERVTSISHTIGEDHWIHMLAGGKQIKVFEDKRRNDEVVTEHLK